MFKQSSFIIHLFRVLDEMLSKTSVNPIALALMKENIESSEKWRVSGLVCMLLFLASFTSKAADTAIQLFIWPGRKLLCKCRTFGAFSSDFRTDWSRLVRGRNWNVESTQCNTRNCDSLRRSDLWSGSRSYWWTRRKLQSHWILLLISVLTLPVRHATLPKPSVIYKDRVLDVLAWTSQTVRIECWSERGVSCLLGLLTLNQNRWIHF